MMILFLKEYSHSRSAISVANRVVCDNGAAHLVHALHEIVENWVQLHQITPNFKEYVDAVLFSQHCPSKAFKALLALQHLQITIVFTQTGQEQRA